MKSTLGETLADATLDERGMAGDRTHAARDVQRDKLAGAKKLSLWRALLEASATKHAG